MLFKLRNYNFIMFVLKFSLVFIASIMYCFWKRIDWEEGERIWVSYIRLLCSFKLAPKFLCRLWTCWLFCIIPIAQVTANSSPPPYDTRGLLTTDLSCMMLSSLSLGTRRFQIWLLLCRTTPLIGFHPGLYAWPK